MNFYNPRIASRLARDSRKKVVVNSETVMRKTLIVKDWNGRDLERVVVTSPFNKLDADYSAALGAAQKRHPRAAFFCDRSEGTVVRQ